MGWMQKLYDTYENCKSLVGVVEDENKTPLMPIYHMTQQAQIEATIDTEGCFRTARVLEDKRERTTLIPCTEKSAARSGTNAVPYPLFDKLIYLAGDYVKYRKPRHDRYPEYIAQLSEWCSSPYAHPKVKAVLKYLKKGCLMHDLIAAGVLYVDESGNMPEKWKGGDDTPPIFKAVAGDQANAFVRFQVVPADGSEDLHSRIWKDPSVWQSYIDYQNSLSTGTDFCYILGKKMPVSELSPKYIRRPGDGAKLISANDASGFTYRGRFETPSQAYSIGRETNEKAHNALKWLIQRQAYFNGEQVILSWRTDGAKTPNLCENSLDVLFDLEPDNPVITTGEDFAQRFRNAIAGYGGKLKGGEEACILGLDSATPGRLSVFYYREMPEKDLVDRIRFWHETCRWRFEEFPKKAFGKNAKPIPFIGAPSPETIAEAAYGRQINDKLKKSTVQRLLPCIVDRAALPQDIMLNAARRASNPAGLDKNDNGKTLAVACALIRKYHNDRENLGILKTDEYKERWKMALDTEETDRNYLFGRALAYAQQLESYALNLQGEKRSTNAERMQMAFSQHPARMWKTLYESLSPYLQRLGKRGARYREELNEVISKIAKEDFTNEPLNELYLLGYACQMQKFHEEYEANREKTMMNSEGEEKQ
jgi:CRISPR-associated protein Csd1